MSSPPSSAFPSMSNPSNLTTEQPNTNRSPSPQPGAISARHQQMKRFARSADKRQSVHMLGSIQHLQRHFMKFGVAENQDAVQPRSRFSSSTAQDVLIEENGEEDPSDGNAIPLAPATVAKPPYPLFETPKIDLATLKTAAFDSLRSMEQAWGIRDVADEGEAQGGRFVRVLETLKATVDAVRAVRAWSLAVPASALTQREGSAPGMRSGIGKGKPATTISTPSRPAVVGRVVSGSSVAVVGSKAEGEGNMDPLVELRRRALDVLVCLRGLEEKFRLEEKGDISVEEETDEKQEVVDPQDAPPPERPTVPTIPDPDTENLWLFSERFGETSISEPTAAEKTTWYDRLASGDDGWVYRDDVFPEEVDGERKVVVTYLRAVEGIFEGCPWRDGRGKEDRGDEGDVFGGKGRVEDGSAPKMETAFGEVRSLPDWAVAGRWKDVPDQRILAFLRAHVPSKFATTLPSAQADDLGSLLLNRLSDGYLLIIAFNTVLRHAAGSWGFIPDDDVHDTMTGNGQTEAAAEDDSGRRPREWTFRRAGNLRSWGAALKMRYKLPLVFPVQAVDLKPTLPLTGTDSGAASRQVSPSPSRRPSGVSGESGEGILFDPVGIARREEGWDVTLRRVVMIWIDRVVGEMS